MSDARATNKIVSLAGSTFGLGHVFNPGHRFTSVHFALARIGLAAFPSEGLDLRPQIKRNVDQGPTGSCEGHAGAKGLDACMRIKGKPLPFFPSMAGLYTLARCLDRGNPSAGALQDNGTEGNAVIRAFQEFGVRPIGPMASDGRFSDCEPTTINDEPRLGDMETESACKLVGAYSILETSANDVAGAYQQSLAAFGPVPTASFVDTAFMQWDKSKPPIDGVDMTDPQGGGHKYLIAGCMGWKDGKLVPLNTPGAVRVWLLDNSWGASWGDGDGTAYVTDNFLALTDEREAYDVSRA